ncbi:nuclear transport factor 2 family protein [Cryobacterium ruanii]|uniref:Nuclear transport factor 2 family protein n=1 Tax=Cryobacterium ruanii TaxID=1259197 RepID=A0A4R9AKZ4_9MICO|nr:nuclear transport factor 2 family protein [Cryobacterium ruanii]TFD64367.1 nuclear transport factor 2 family protein [Cryobacterium ruanii]
MSPTTQSRPLPMAITTYLERSVSAKPASARATFAENAVVVDDGKTYTGEAAIAAWLAETVTEFEYTTTQLRIEKDETATTVVNRIAGNFPGRSVDLSYRFELDAESGLIQALTISI